MKFFADTASLPEIEYCFSRGVDDGITTNPKIMETTGDLSLGFEAACKNILKRYPNVPVSLETDLRGIDPRKISSTSPEQVRDVLLSQAYQISGWGNNVVVKIPVCAGGLLATRELASKGIRTNVTACMTPYQALEAAKAGATYVSLFANRMLDSQSLEMAGRSLEEISSQSPAWKDTVKQTREKYFEPAWQQVLTDISYVAKTLEGSGTELIIGSIRGPKDMLRLSTAQPQIITIPPQIVRDMVNIPELKSTLRTAPTTGYSTRGGITHPMTQHILEEFEKAAEAYRK